jgi:hypothetical protein
MQKRDRFALALAVCLFAAVSAFAQTETVYFTVTPNQIYIYDVETFVTIRGVVPGTESTVVFYTDGENQFSIEAAPEPTKPGILDAWVPIQVSTTAGRYTVTVVSTDTEGGKRTYGPAFFDVIDRPNTDPPLLNLPESLVVEATSSEGAAATFDDSGAICNHPSGALFSMGATTVTCSATNAFGTTTGSFVVFVTDTVVPVISAPEEVISATNAVTYTASAADNIDGAIALTCDHASGSTFSNGETLVQCSAHDAHSNYAYASFKVFVQQGPVLRLPADITAEATGPTGASVAYTATADGATISCSPASGSAFPLGLTLVHCEASNLAGSSTGAFGVTVVDTTAPKVTVPADITRGATDPSGVAVTFTASANDLVDGPLTATCSPASGSTFPIGSTYVLCLATDAHFNEGGSSFYVTVGSDSTPPVLTLPANITREATGASGATVTYTATANDNVDGPVPVTCNPASGLTFALGTTTVQCSATDAAGNPSNGSFTVTVRDTTPPTLSLPADKVVEAAGPSGAVVTYTATSTDIVDGSVTVICAPASGSTFPLGTTNVQCSATDAHLNKATGSFNVTVRDTAPPTVASTTPSPTSLWPPNHQMVAVSVAVIASDTVDPHPVSTILSVSSNQPINGTGDGDTAPDWQITGPLTVDLRSERAGGAARIYTITIATADFSGNTAISTCQVTVGANGKGRAVH